MNVMILSAVKPRGRSRLLGRGCSIPVARTGRAGRSGPEASFGDRLSLPAFALASCVFLSGGVLGAPSAPGSQRGLAPSREIPSREGRALSPDDLYAIRTIDALEISPDGGTLAYVVRQADLTKNAFVHTLWLMPAEGGEPRLVSRRGSDDTSPVFSSDGTRLAFLADRGKEAQIFVARTGSRHAHQITRVAEGVDDFDRSPDGNSFVFVARDPWRPASGAVTGENARRSPDSEGPEIGPSPGPDPIVVRRTQIRSDVRGFLDDRRDHLYVVSAKAGEPRRITSGSFDDSSPRWSPDGRWIAFLSNRTPDPDTNDDTDVFLVHPDGTGLTRLSSTAGPDDAPSWSHRGDRLAWVGALRANDYYQTTHVMVAPIDGGETIDLTRSLDAWVSAELSRGSDAHARIHWSDDDATLFVAIDRRGANYVASIPSAGGTSAQILGGASVKDLVRLAPTKPAAPAPARAIAGPLFFVMSDPTHLPEIYRARADGTAQRRLSHLNDALISDVKLSDPGKILAKNSDGDTIEAWLYPPVDLDPARKYPLILYIHGGPQEYDGEAFDLGLENQIFPGLGWAVLRVNYRGSTSYGERFCRAVRGDWHHREYDDLMAAVDAALEKPWLDPARLGIGGWSYGGIMTVWTVAHTDRFKVGVPERFEIDYLSSFGEDQWFAQYLEEFGSPFDKADVYRLNSPGSYASRIRTPLFMISDAEDANCPLPQAMQMYQRLKVLGLPTELVIYPGEHHSMQHPRHLTDRLNRLVEWFGAYLKSP